MAELKSPEFKICPCEAALLLSDGCALGASYALARGKSLVGLIWCSFSKRTQKASEACLKLSTGVLNEERLQRLRKRILEAWTFRKCSCELWLFYEFLGSCFIEEIELFDYWVWKSSQDLLYPVIRDRNDHHCKDKSRHVTLSGA